MCAKCQVTVCEIVASRSGSSRASFYKLPGADREIYGRIICTYICVPHSQGARFDALIHS